jgi:glycosyltransferase involved in cell wall biosynthesis
VNPDSGIYAWAGGAGGCNYFRQLEPLRVLIDQGVNGMWGPLLTNDELQRFDTIQVHQLNEPRASVAWQKLARHGAHRLIIDVDDDVWNPDFLALKLGFTAERLSTLESNLRVAHVVTTPSPVLAEKLLDFNRNVWVVPNTVPAWLLDHRPVRNRTHRRGYPLSQRYIGWQGSDHHRLSMTPLVLVQLRDFMRNHQGWSWRIYGPHRVEWEGNQDRIEYTPWQQDVDSYYRSVAIDVGIGPLQRTPFTAAKSSLRAIEYAAMGVPAVLSDEPPYRGWVTPDTGFLIDPDRRYGWFEALDLLARNPDLAKKMGRAARERARMWTTEAAITAWVEAWNSVAEQSTRGAERFPI